MNIQCNNRHEKKIHERKTQYTNRNKEKQRNETEESNAQSSKPTQRNAKQSKETIRQDKKRNCNERKCKNMQETQ